MKNSGIKLLVMDLDGTLLTSQKTLAKSSIEAVNNAMRMGIEAVIASARPPRSTMPYYRELCLDTPMVNYNGAMITDPVKGKVLLHCPLDLKISQNIIQTCRAMHPEILVSAEILDKWYTDRVDARFMTETAAMFGPDVIDDINDWLVGDVTKLLIQGDDDCLEKIYDRLRRDFGNLVYMVYMDKGLIQIMSNKADKAKAVKLVADSLGIRCDQVMAIGDNANDNGMLRWAQIGVAMENAAQDTKTFGDYITSSNDDDGVAKAIEKFIF